MKRLLWAAGAAAVLAYTLLPLLWLLSLSLKSPATIGDQRLWPADPTLANYRGLVDDSASRGRCSTRSASRCSPPCSPS